jgi:predicted CxxxxCH...CXXCH cytochrome family protein
MLTRRALVVFSLILTSALVACAKARPTELTSGTNCSSCHGDPPQKDVHFIHSGLPQPGSLGKAFECKECHQNVQNVSDIDHIVDADGKPLPPPAVVRFDDPSALAAKTEAGSVRAAQPAYDRASRTCSNIYCHGATLKGQTMDVVQTPRWDAAGEHQADCGKCHGIPPTDHPAGIHLTDCATCHTSIDAQGRLSADRHVNGVVDLRAGNLNSCSGCHGDATAQNVQPGDPRSAPPTDLAGNATSAAVGAHQAHLTGTRWRASPIACDECHVVPNAVLNPGHVDNQVQIAFGPLATAESATSGAPSYAAAARTCSNVYCHGNFSNSGRVTTPLWTAGSTAADCGTCHALPPPAPQHPASGAVSCGSVGCHSAKYSAGGAGGFTVDPDLHLDGKHRPNALE